MPQSENNIKNQIIDFYNNPLVQKLNAYYGKTTIFNILKIERNENRHSAFLAWLLDKNGSHGLGEEPIKKFMRLLAKVDSKYDNPFLVGNYHVENMQVETEFPVKADGHNKTGRIDIYIKFDYKFDNDADDKEILNHVHIILENKVYTNEHDDQTKLYYDWAKQNIKEKNKDIIGVFLAPEKPEKCSGDTNDFKYVRITYKDILVQVIEPLLVMEMSDETRIMISDYLINLGQPLKAKKEDDKNTDTGEDTILAISKENEDSFIKIYNENNDLLDSALYAECVGRAEKHLKIVYSDLERFKALSEIELGFLKYFWASNKKLLRMILNTALNNNSSGDGNDDEKNYQNAISILLRLNGSNRDNTKYLVYAKNGDLMNDGSKPAPKSQASFYVFKAWVHDNPTASLDDIRKAFPVEIYAKHYIDTFQYLFYKKEDVENAIKNNDSGHDYVVAPMDENNSTTMAAKKYLKWDFFTGNTAEKCYLTLNGIKVLSIKMWLKDEFYKLLDYARDNHSIRIEEQ